KCTPIKDQGACGSCWAFAPTGVLESAIKIHDGVERDLSEQYLLSCNTDGWSCNGGFWAHDYHLNRIPPGELNAGAVYESDFPYRGQRVACRTPHPHYEKILSWGLVAGYGMPSVAALKQAIYNYGPVTAGVCAGNAFVRYMGGIFQTDERSQCPYGTNHAVILVGWDDIQGIWYLRNSWGTRWGENGMMRIKYGISSVGEDASYIEYKRSNTSDGAKPDNPQTVKLFLPVVAR
ncbi:MAG: C1 family peptidase, partial [Anaerolineae bacterium]|nr:C1 family peptidase [Anaerolineae bacterium]